MNKLVSLVLACFPLIAAAQNYSYEGTITFRTLSGKECGEAKIGDTRKVVLSFSSSSGIDGYYQMEGGDAVRLSGKKADALELESPDPADSHDHLALQGVGRATLRGEMRASEGKSETVGCYLAEGDISATRTSESAESVEQKNKLAQAFESAREEYAARQRDPVAYVEVQNLLSQITQAEAQDNPQPLTALRLREQLQGLVERTYGAGSVISMNNLALQARLQGTLQRVEQELLLRRQILALAERHYPQQVAASAFNLGDVLEKLDRKQEAAAAFARAAQADEASYGSEHPEVADDLQRQAKLLESLQQRQQAVALYQRILLIRENSPDSKVEVLQQAQDDLARTRDPEAYAQLADLADKLDEAWNGKNLALAVELRLQMQPLAARCLGKPSRFLADLLYNQAADLEALNRDQEALVLYPQALAMREAAYGREHMKTAAVLGNYAYQYRKMGQYSQAIPLYQRALAINEKVFGPEHPGTATILNELAGVYDSLGKFDQASPLYQRALAIREKTLGQQHVDTALTLNNLALMYKAQGQYDRALPLYQRALAIYEKVSGPEHPDTATSLNNLASLYQSIDQHDKALPLYQRALAINEKVLGADHPGTATGLNNLALLYKILGQYDQALPLYQRALAIREKSLGPEHADTATSLNNLAVLYQVLRQYDQALPLHQRALSIRTKTLGPNHQDTASSLNNLATLYQTIGQYEQALSLYQRALAIDEQVLGAAHSDVAVMLGNVGMLHEKLNQYDQALPLFQRALAIDEKALGSDHSGTAADLHNLAFLYGVLHQSGNALKLFLRGRDTTSHVIARTFPILTEQQKLEFVKQQEWSYHGLLSLIHRQLQNDAAVKAGLDTVLLRKGIVFDAQARQQDAIVRSLDSETKTLWDALAAQRAQLVRLMQAGPGKETSEDYQTKLKALEETIARLESQLAAKSALVAQDLKQRKVTSKEVSRVLGKEATLIEYAKIQDYDWDHANWSDTWRYLAFILKQNGNVQLIDLGEASALEQDVQVALKVMGRVGTDLARQQDATRMLYQRLWQPLAQAVGSSTNIIFSPDGLLNLVPFAALQDKQGRYLIENRQISYVTSGRDLTKNDLGIKPQTELYLAANPQFDLIPGTVSQSVAIASSASMTGGTRSIGFDQHFSPLPGTEKEAEQIPTYLAGNKIVLTGISATEDAVLNAPRARVMHLSTHGFFLTDQAPITQGTRGAERIDSGKSGAELTSEGVALPPGYENPLVRSGLAFAGANHASESEGGSDGLLTALEVSSMDLHGTDLVTLSACETGRGEVKTGEGVFGLRRAFALAGTAHLMMSLWPVSDEVTAQQMQSFYRLYGKKFTPAAALRKAQLATIAELQSKHGYAEPALWAPFIVQGW